MNSPAPLEGILSEMCWRSKKMDIDVNSLAASYLNWSVSRYIHQHCVQPEQTLCRFFHCDSQRMGWVLSIIRGHTTWPPVQFKLFLPQIFLKSHAVFSTTFDKNVVFSPFTLTIRNTTRNLKLSPQWWRMCKFLRYDADVFEELGFSFLWA
jgi:hypothetical protein